MKPERLDELIQQHLAGDCSPAENEELMTILSHSEPARQRLATAAEALVELSEVLGRPQPEVRRPRARRLYYWALPAAVAATLLIALSFNWFGGEPPIETQPLPELAGPIEQVVRPEQQTTRDIQRSTQKPAINPQAGSCQAGAGAIFSVGGMSDAGRQVLKLESGTLSLDVAAGQTGFVIETPEGRVEDIGTRFTLNAQAQGTMVSVSEGRVHFQPAAAGAGFELVAATGPTTLLRDGRVASVQELQGLAWVRPGASERRTPIASGAVIRVGDLLGMGKFGAHAIALQLNNGARLYLGPGSTLAFEGVDRLRLIQGDCALEVPKAASIAISVDGKEELRAGTGESYYRAVGGKIETLPTVPFWLDGFRNDRLVESLGKLVAQVDGRDVPLTMGYHKVSVDIRDQIARTVIEESFINHSKARLEGIFYFPLPSDASISSFAMWIGDEKVEGEIVEKQRAREIYETILRERRDPGLLEWTGGSIFKARIFPIDYEKKIQIGYTQVLQKRAGKVRYRYPLRSELLRQNPLSRLELIVKLASESPIQSFRSLSHPGREVLTEKAASFEFSADNYIPERDFELEFESQSASNSLRFLPHLRGDEGYFMALAEAPAATTDDRGLLPEAEPQDWLLLVDNSASVDDHLRDLQAQLLEALLSTMTEKDRFNLALFDVQSRWLHADRRAGGATSTEEVLAFLSQHEPLGWTDHAQVLKAARGRTKANTKIILIGDGADSLKTEDLGGFGRALSASWNDGPPVHVVALGSATEDILLEDLARLGGGSFRRLTLAEDASARAAELASGLLSPGLSDLQLEIDGVPTAAVHLVGSPTIPAGGQAILVGRYDSKVTPNGPSTVHLRGRQVAETVALSTECDFQTPDIGNSFIPRLWARRHLDYLLRLGAGKAVVEQIIALSAEFQIATPYTSFLVLESDADRERFGIKRRTRMRDGEDFFAAGREAADFELVRAQMLRAQAWRDDLSELVLAKYRSSGVDLMGQIMGGYSNVWDGRGYASWGLGVNDSHSMDLFAGASIRDSVLLDLPTTTSAIDMPTRYMDFDVEMEADFEDSDSSAGLPVELGQRMQFLDKSNLAEFSRSRRRDDYYGQGSFGRYAYGLVPQYQRYSRARAFPLGGRVDLADASSSPALFQQLFPYLGQSTTAARKELDWPAEAIRIAAALNTMSQLRAQGIDLRWEIHQEGNDPAERSIAKQFLLGLKSSWVQELGYAGDEVTELWSTGSETTAWSSLWNAGRRRKTAAYEPEIVGQKLPLLFHDFLPRNQHSELVFEKSADGHYRFRFFQPGSRDSEYRYTVQESPLRILKLEQFFYDKLHRAEVSEDYLDIHGLSLPQKVRHLDADGTLLRTDQFRFQTPSPEALEASIAKAIAQHEDAVFLPERSTSVPQARQALLQKTADLKDHLVLLDDLYNDQRFREAEAHLQILLAAAVGKPLHWAVQLTALRLQGLQEDLKRGLATTREEILRTPEPTNLARVRHLFSWASSLAVSERMEVLLSFEDLVRASGRRSQIISWRDQVLTTASAWDQREDYSDLLDGFILEFPDDLNLLNLKLHQLGKLGLTEDYLNYCQRLMTDASRSIELRQHFHDAYGEKLDREKRYAEYLRFREAPPAAGLTKSQAIDERFLLALLQTGQVERYDDFVTSALQLGFSATPPLQELPLWLGLQAATGQLGGRQLTRHHLKFLPQLMSLAEFSLEHFDRDWVLRSLVDAGGLANQQVMVDFRAKLAARIMTKLETMTSAEILSWEGYITNPSDREVLHQAIFDRFLAIKSLNQAFAPFHFLAQSMASDQLRFLFEHLLDIASPGSETGQVLQLILSHLEQLEFTDELEDSIISLALKLSLETESVPDREHRILIARLQQLVTLIPRLTRWRQSLTIASIDGLEELGPRALEAQTAAAEKQAHLAIAKKLEAAGNRMGGALGLWLKFFALDSSRQASDAVADLVPEAIELASTCYAAMAPEPDVRTADQVLAERAFALAAYLAINTDSTEGIDQLLATFKSREKPGFDRQRVELEWLCASKQLAALSQALQTIWTAGKPDLRVLYGKSYAQILAAEGEIAAAIKTLQELEVLRPLEAEERNLIASWQQLEGDRSESQEALASKFEALSEWQLSSYLSNQVSRFQGQGDSPPEQLAEEQILAFKILFERSTNPSQHAWVLLNYWQATKDHRLLQGLAQSLRGQSSQGIYNYIDSLRTLIDNIHEEAALDALDQAIAAALTDPADPVVRRALALLRFHFMERAVNQLRGARAWRERLISALKAAYPNDFAVGEARIYVASLASLGRIEDEEVRKLVDDQMARAMATTAQYSEERFKIAAARARFLRDNSQTIAAANVLEAAFRELAATRSGRLPAWSRHYQESYSSYLIEVGAAATAIHFWRQQLELSNSMSETHWLRLQLIAATEAGLRADITTYELIRIEFLEVFRKERHPDRAKEILDAILKLWHTAARSQPKAKLQVVTDLKQLAFNELPGRLAEQHYRAAIEQVQALTHSLRQLVDDQTALDFILLILQAEPRNSEALGQPLWSFVAHLVADIMRQRPRSGVTEAWKRYLLHELKRDLASGISYDRNCYSKRTNYFIGSMATTFRATALEILDAERTDEALARRVTSYLAEDLDLPELAADTLQKFARRQGLSPAGKLLLIQFRESARQFAIAADLIGRLAQEQPEDFGLQIRWARALHRAGRTELSRERAAMIEKDFLSENLRNLGNLEALAHLSHDLEAWEQCVRLTRDLIRQAGREGSNTGGTVSSRHWLTIALGKLGRTDEAVEAAMAGIAIQPRREAQDLAALRSVLRQAKDFDAWLSRFDAEVEKTKLDQPILRSAIAEHLAQDSRFLEAAEHYELALLAAPENDAWRESLAEVYVQAKDNVAADRVYLDQVRRSPHDFSRWQRLAERLERRGQTEAAERTLSSIVEFSAREAPGLKLYAEAVEARDDFEAAIEFWGRVDRAQPEDPEGLLGQLRAEVQLGRRNQALQVVRQVRQRDFAERFGNLEARMALILKGLDD